MARILVIEEDYSLRYVIGQALAGDGHEVVEAPTADEGLRLWHAGGADLVLTDLLMPEARGIAVILELRAFAKGLPIVAMPAAQITRTLDLLEETRLLGTIGLLPKPFSLGQLLRAVAAALSGEPTSDRIRSA
jgi:CheY-like chemotaxis protein